MRTLSLTIILALFMFAAALPTNAFAKGGDSAAGQFVQRLGDKALTSLTAKGIPQNERAGRVRSLLRENFDITTIGRFVLGTHYREASEAQRAEYFKLFEDMIVQTYTRRFSEYSGQSFKVLGTEPGGGADTMVKSQILQPSGPPVDVDWRVRDKGGQMKIVDVLVDGISMSLTQRDDFDGVIQAGGGKIDALLDSMSKHQVKAR